MKELPVCGAERVSPLDAYTGAFARYLLTGTVGALADFCAEGADVARLRVYRNGFLRACIEALRANYPSVERLVGEERFPLLARPWVEAHPPGSAGPFHAVRGTGPQPLSRRERGLTARQRELPLPGAASLVEYGESFAQYMDDMRDTHGLDWLTSFAALDRAWTEVYFAEDDADPAPAADGLDDAEALMSLRGRLSPRVRLVSLDFRVLDAWSRLREGGLGRRTEIRRMPQNVLVWRNGAEVLYRDLAPPEHAFIAGVAAGRSCGDAAGAALGIDAEFDLAAAFASLLHHDMLTFEH